MMSPSDELLALSSVEMRRRIGTKEISPVELVEASIARIDALNPAVNAIAATDFARARKIAMGAESAARKGEQLGLLHGLPTGIKDLHETAGLLTTYGSPLYRSHVPAHDAAMVALVRKAGAIILCKTNVPEFGAGANTRNLVWGATGNPFDPRLNAGGSSGGSAVALACDMLPVCTGSDTGGSLRIPAAICGVWPHFHTGIADLAALGIPRERILHVGQSLRADVTPANKLGLKCAWINRPGRLLGLSGEGAAEAKPDLVVSSLGELVATISAND
jgi:Amidase